MRKLKLLVCVSLIAFGCGPADRGGEKGILSFRFGLGGCNSVTAANATLARGGSTDLVVADATAAKRGHVTVVSESAAVIDTAADELDLVCNNEKCEQMQGTLPLSALSTGSSRLTFSSGGEMIDALTVRVADATSMTLSDTDGKVKDVHAAVGKPIELAANLRAGDATAYAKTSFDWSVDGAALGATESHESHVRFTPASPGTSTVTVRFGALSAQLPVTVDAAN